MSARTVQQGRASSQTGRADYWRHGDFNRICDRCGFKHKASQTRKEWNGLIVCKKCYEPRHPQDFVRGRRDRQAVREARPDTEAGIIVVSENLTMSGASVTTSSLVPAGSLLFEVETEVLTAITGAESYDVGDGTDVDKWGAAIDIEAGTTSGATVDTYTDAQASFSASAQDVTLTANGANFSAGVVKVTARYKVPVAEADL